MKSALARKSVGSTGTGTVHWLKPSLRSSKKSTSASADDMVARHAYIDLRSQELVVETRQGFVAGLPLKQIELESPSPVASVAIEAPGDIVLLTHADGTVTHLPVDMWLPGGFTPATRGVNRRDR